MSTLIYEKRSAKISSRCQAAYVLNTHLDFLYLKMLTPKKNIVPSFFSHFSAVKFPCLELDYFSATHGATCCPEVSLLYP